MTEIWSSAGLIWHPRMQKGACTVTGAKLDLELNKAGSLSFKLPTGHPRAEQLPKLSTECWVTRDGEEIFRGRVLYSDRDLKNCRDIFCEGLRNVLNDEILRPEDLSANGTYSGSAAGLIDLACAAYNARHPGGVQFARGTVSSFGTIKAEAKDYPKIGEFLDGVIEEYGGYLSVRRVNGVNRIDYTVDSGGVNSQQIKFGVNLIELLEHVTGEDVFTVVIPLGKDLGENRGRLTIKTAQSSGGKDYIENAEAIAALGVQIAKTVTFEEIDDPDALYAAGAACFSSGGGLTNSIKLSTLDMHLADVEIDALRLGEHNHLYAKPLGLDLLIPLTQCSIDLLDQQNNEYTFGLTWSTLTENQAKNRRTAKTAQTALQTASAAKTEAAAAQTTANAAATAAGDAATAAANAASAASSAQSTANNADTAASNAASAAAAAQSTANSAATAASNAASAAAAAQSTANSAATAASNAAAAAAAAQTTANSAATAASNAAAAAAAAQTTANAAVPQTTTVNGHALSGNVVVTAGDLGIGDYVVDNGTQDAVFTIPAGNKFGGRWYWRRWQSGVMELFGSNITLGRSETNPKFAESWGSYYKEWFLQTIEVTFPVSFYDINYVTNVTSSRPPIRDAPYNYNGDLPQGAPNQIGCVRQKAVNKIDISLAAPYAYATENVNIRVFGKWK